MSVMGLPRINSQDVLVVPPCECAWLCGESFELKSGRGCVVFEARGGHDATVILRSEPGSKRYEYGAGEGGGRPSSYTIKLGSHRNGWFELERNGTTVFTTPSPPGLALTATEFSAFWVNYADGAIAVGRNTPGRDNMVQHWQDPHPLENIRNVGLSTWDNHMAYRNIEVLPAVDLSAEKRPGRDERANNDETRHISPSLLQICARTVAAHIHRSNACEVLSFTEALLLPTAGGDELREAAAGVTAANFSEILSERPDRLCALSAESLKRVAKHSNMSATEVQLFQGIMQWAGYEAGKPHALAPQLRAAEELCAYVRFPLMSDAEVAAVADHPVVRHSPALQQLLATACTEQASGTRVQLQGRELLGRVGEGALRWQNRTPRQRREIAARCYDLMYVSDGDSNGVIGFLGTSLGTKPFVNPMIERRIGISCSSPSGRHCDPRLLASRKFVHTSMAGPRQCGDERLTWWAIDLGSGTQLVANYYTIRQDGSSNFPRSWALQGSNDAAAGWTDLRAHRDDAAVKRPAQFASWPLQCRAAGGYRHFRLLLTGPTASEHPPERHCLSLCGVELYGSLYITP